MNYTITKLHNHNQNVIPYEKEVNRNQTAELSWALSVLIYTEVNRANKVSG